MAVSSFPPLSQIGAPAGKVFRTRTETHQNILDKLEVHSKAEAIAFAFQKQLF